MAASTVQAKSVNNGVNTSVQDAYKNDAVSMIYIDFYFQHLFVQASMLGCDAWVPFPQASFQK